MTPPFGSLLSVPGPSMKLGTQLKIHVCGVKANIYTGLNMHLPNALSLSLQTDT